MLGVFRLIGIKDDPEQTLYQTTIRSLTRKELSGLKGLWFSPVAKLSLGMESCPPLGGDRLSKLGLSQIWCSRRSRPRSLRGPLLAWLVSPYEPRHCRCRLSRQTRYRPATRRIRQTERVPIRQSPPDTSRRPRSFNPRNPKPSRPHDLQAAPQSLRCHRPVPLETKTPSRRRYLPLQKPTISAPVVLDRRSPQPRCASP